MEKRLIVFEKVLELLRVKTIYLVKYFSQETTQGLKEIKSNSKLRSRLHSSAPILFIVIISKFAAR